MTNPLEGTYRLLFWEVGRDSAEPTDSGRTGTLAEMSDLGHQVTEGRGDLVTFADGRDIVREELAGYVVQPEASA